MKNNKFSKGLLAFILLPTLIFVGCNKDVNISDIPEPEIELMAEVSKDDAIADQIFGEIHEQELGLREEFDEPGIGLNNEPTLQLDSLGNRCVKMTITPRGSQAFPKTVTLDYGTGCVGRDGKMRRGKIITMYSAPMVRPGATAITRFESFSIDSVQVEGKHTTKNNSTSTARIFIRTVENGKLTFPRSRVSTWNAVHTNKQIAGLGTPGFPLDDVFEITGGARGTHTRLNQTIEWSRRIETPLQKAFKCRWIEKGTVYITRNGRQSIIDFGDGTCDNKATITINGQTREFTL